jgi:ribose-phosphate pyrophosphokinase
MIKLNNVLVNFEEFPNGETRIDGLALSRAIDGHHSHVEFKYETDADLIKLMFVKRYIDSLTKAPSSLEISYMPYSRMDRAEGLSVFTLKYVADFINSLNFDTVAVHEAHSDVTAAVLNNCTAINEGIPLLHAVMDEIGFDPEKDYVFYPDAGAQKRYSKLKKFNQLVGFKQRDFETGRIDKLDVVGDMEPGGKVIILDDLCSFGGTFMLSAEKLKELGAGHIYLAVTHCEESIFKGKIPESDLITKVYTTDSIINESQHDKVDIFMTVGWNRQEENEVTEVA